MVQEKNAVESDKWRGEREKGKTNERWIVCIFVAAVTSFNVSILFLFSHQYHISFVLPPPHPVTVQKLNLSLSVSTGQQVVNRENHEENRKVQK